MPETHLRWTLERKEEVGNALLSRFRSPFGTVLYALENAELAIPPGLYLCKRGMYYGGDGEGGKLDYETFIVTGVPGRSQVKIHVANEPAELEGCIAPGMKRGEVDGEGRVWHSWDAFRLYMKETRRLEQHWLYVTPLEAAA